MFNYKWVSYYVVFKPGPSWSVLKLSAEHELVRKGLSRFSLITRWSASSSSLSLSVDLFKTLRFGAFVKKKKKKHCQLGCFLWIYDFFLLLVPRGRSVAGSLLRLALQRRALNRWSWTLLSLVTDAVTCHSTQTHSQRFRVETPEEWLWIGDCVWARWNLFTLIGTMQIAGEPWASCFFFL